MPDLAMCPSETCPVRGVCYRNAASGTKPTDERQTWAYFARREDEGRSCHGFILSAAALEPRPAGPAA